jgi:hypothetical protein
MGLAIYRSTCARTHHVQNKVSYVYLIFSTKSVTLLIVAAKWLLLTNPRSSRSDDRVLFLL